MLTSDLWPLAAQAWQALSAHYGPAMARAAAEDAGLPAGTYFGWMLPALGLDPEPISAGRLAAWAPFTAASLEERRLEASAQLGLLRRGAAGDYHLTEAGRTAARHIIAAAYRCMAALQPLPLSGLERLAHLLRRLVEASLAAPEPAGKFHLRLSRRTDSAGAAPIVAQIDQYLTDLNAYRDDCHLAAWQGYGVPGHEWEALTCIWRGEASTLDELAAGLARRGHSREAYAAALQDLVGRGWLAQAAEGYQLTDLGRRIRDDAEMATDRSFYAAWGCLNEAELEELRTLLTGFRDGLSA